MEKQLKELLEEIDYYHTSEDIDYDNFDKLSNSDPMPGQKVAIYWIDREFPDKGYLFQLPHQIVDEFDLCVHVTDVDNSDGMDSAPDEYKHLYSLVELERVDKIYII